MIPSFCCLKRCTYAGPMTISSVIAGLKLKTDEAKQAVQAHKYVPIPLHFGGTPTLHFGESFVPTQPRQNHLPVPFHTERWRTKHRAIAIGMTSMLLLTCVLGSGLVSYLPIAPPEFKMGLTLFFCMPCTVSQKAHRHTRAHHLVLLYAVQSI